MSKTNNSNTELLLVEAQRAISVQMSNMHTSFLKVLEEVIYRLNKLEELQEENFD